MRITLEIIQDNETCRNVSVLSIKIEFPAGIMMCVKPTAFQKGKNICHTEATIHRKTSYSFMCHSLFNFSNFYPKIKQNILWIMNKRFNIVWVTNLVT